MILMILRKLSSCLSRIIGMKHRLLVHMRLNKLLEVEVQGVVMVLGVVQVKSSKMMKGFVLQFSSRRISL